MPTPRPIFVSAHTESLFAVHLPDNERPHGRHVRNAEGDTEVSIYSTADLPGLRVAAEKVSRVLEHASDVDDSDRRQLHVLLGVLAVHEEAQQIFPYPDEVLP